MENNHIFIPFIENSKRISRLQIPSSDRRKGLWVTYISCKNIPTTEYYIGDNFDDDHWGCNNNWASPFNEEFIEAAVKDLLKWYKVK